MGCTSPLTAFRTESGDILFKEIPGSRELKLPCGQCIGCRLRKSADWATRCVHEASLHEDNCFITLTYNAEHLPPDGGLVKRDFVNFMKRVRKRIYPKKIKFYMCGEYGDRNNRPHYHAILFGYNYPDWLYLFDSPGGTPVYTSPLLEKDWQKQGFVTVGTVTFESAAYVARYVMKKLNGKLADQIDPDTGLKHYERINSFTGEVVEVHPEYSTMSRGGCHGRGIAYDWIKCFHSDVYPKDFTTVKNVKIAPPRYYDKIYSSYINPDLFDDVKAGRLLSLSEHLDEFSDQRLKMKEIINEAKHSLLKRSL